MTTSEQVVLYGSASRVRADATAIDTAPDMAEVVRLVLLVRRREEIPDSLVTGLAAITPDELTQKYGADPADIRLVSDVMEGCGLRVVSADAASRRVVVEQSLARAASVFDVKISHYEASDAFSGSPVRYRGHGQLHMPGDLDGVVVSVFGLDDQPRVIPMFRVIEGQPQIVYTPPDLARLYAFPGETDGAGQTLAIITVTGGYRQQDVDAYFAQLGLPVPSISVVSVDGVQNAPGPAGQPPCPADIEAVLDVEIAGALVPAARIVNYFAPNTDSGLLESVRAAVHATPAPTAISLSWGATESSHSSHFVQAMEGAFREAAALGITVCAASGDSGSGNDEHDGGSHVNYPASSPHVLSIGGTTLIGDPGAGTITSETVWNGGSGRATGGGVSNLFDLPDWQAQADVPNRFGKAKRGRGVPDVAANADTDTGYQFLLNGKTGFVGGTSAATPLWAALVCRLAQGVGRPFGLLQPLIYPEQTTSQAAAGFRDVIAGDNGSYAAAPGWDPNTGLGSPDGAALLNRLREATAAHRD
ncbi:MAG TPA: S53 family peptidase [Trebonia sp.]|jgi:kumamolisin|nr:S53 family peptidase [Trebonia sp.]